MNDRQKPDRGSQTSDREEKRDEGSDERPEHADEDSWAGDMKGEDEPDHRQELSVDRTAMAEDRTVLASERTFASWMRTGLAAVGIGLGFHALFVSMEPWWAPRAIATVFFCVGMFVTISAEQRATTVVKKLHAHKVEAVGVGRLRVITIITCGAIAALIVALWMLPLD